MQATRSILKTISKIILVLIIAAGLFLAGLMIGFGIIGDGSPMGVFDREVWQHILEFM